MSSRRLSSSSGGRRQRSRTIEICPDCPSIKPVKIVLLGDVDLGKKEFFQYFYTSAREKAIDGKDTLSFHRHGTPVTLVQTEGKEGEEYDRLRRMKSYFQADIFLIFYSMDVAQSYVSVKERWLPEVEKFFQNIIPVGLVSTGTGRPDKDFLKEEDISFRFSVDLDEIDDCFSLLDRAINVVKERRESSSNKQAKIAANCRHP